MMPHPDDPVTGRHSRIRRDHVTDGVRTRDATGGELRAGETAHLRPEVAAQDPAPTAPRLPAHRPRALRAFEPT
jgi:hypothetical protein